LLREQCDGAGAGTGKELVLRVSSQAGSRRFQLDSTQGASDPRFERQMLEKYEVVLVEDPNNFQWSLAAIA
jgi:hypothetical protein